MESALRCGWVYISSHLIPLATGIDINELLLECSLGIEKNVDQRLRENLHKAAGYVCFYLPEGIISAVDGVEEIQRLPFVHMTALNDIRCGARTEKMLHKGMRKGPILVSGKDREEIERNIEQVQRLLKITVQTEEGQTSEIHWS